MGKAAKKVVTMKVGRILNVIFHQLVFDHSQTPLNCGQISLGKRENRT